MQHIESRTGNSYSIFEMSDKHLLATINLYVERFSKLRTTIATNPRFLYDAQRIIESLSKYYFVASTRKLVDIQLEEKIIKIGRFYEQQTTEIYIRRD